jgi:hypothetical protein
MDARLKKIQEIIPHNYEYVNDVRDKIYQVSEEEFDYIEQLLMDVDDSLFDLRSEINHFINNQKED